MSKPREDFEKEWTNDETHIIVMRCISSSLAITMGGNACIFKLILNLGIN